jgi:secondary thiamine-phosphate synthase enzyme
MKHFRTVLKLTTRRSAEIIDITAQVAAACRASTITEGLALVFPHHTSAAVYVSDSDPNLAADWAALLARLAPANGTYQHNLTDPKRNAHGHLQASLAGHHVTLPVTGGQLDLGAFQTVYYAECDGRREKEVIIKIIGE